MPHRILCFIGIIMIIFSSSSLFATPNPEKILKQCIKKHGGWENFTKIRDFYAKMDVHTYSQKGDIESIFYEYFRKPDKLRIEIHPLLEPPTKISWDGKTAWHMIKDKLKETKDRKIIERLQESLRFLRLMVLTNLFEKGVEFYYERHIQKKSYGIHVILRTNPKKEKIRLYISDKNFVPLFTIFWMSCFVTSPPWLIIP